MSWSQHDPRRLDPVGCRCGHRDRARLLTRRAGDHMSAARESLFSSNRPLPPDSPLNELRLLWEYVEMYGDGFSAENWAKIEDALTRVAGVVVAADKWAHGYEACSSAPIDKYLFMVVRGMSEIGVPVKTAWGTTEVVEFEDGLTIPPKEWGNFA